LQTYLNQCKQSNDTTSNNPLHQYAGCPVRVLLGLPFPDLDTCKEASKHGIAYISWAMPCWMYGWDEIFDKL
jgi:hypothetical protein